MTTRYFIVRAAVAILAAGLVAVSAQDPQAPPAGGTPAPPGGTPAPAGRPVDPAGGAPGLELTPSELNFGEVWESEPAQGDFTVRNVGTAPLTIELKSSCGCTIATRPKSPLGVGESTTFTIKYDTVKRRNGRASQQITVLTNDPQRPRVSVPVIGLVKPLYEGGDGIYFYQLHSAARKSRTIRLQNKYDSPVHFKLKEGQNFGPFDITLKEVEPGQVFELTAATHPPLPIKSNLAEVVLATGLPRVPELRIHVQAHVLQDVWVSPGTIRVGRKTSYPTPATVDVRCRTDQPVKIIAVTSSAPGLTWEVQPPKRAGEDWLAQRIGLVIPPGEKLPPGDAEIQISTDSPDVRYQKLLVRVQVLESQIGPAPLAGGPRPPAAEEPPKTTEPGTGADER